MGSPMLLNAGANNPFGYQLKVTSLAINSGVLHLQPAFSLAGKGIFKSIPVYPLVDYFGNKLSKHPDCINIGAFDIKNGETILPKKIAAKGVINYLSEISLIKGNQVQLFAQVLPANADNKKIIWKSLNPFVANVSNGLVIGINTGTAKIIVISEDGSFEDEMIVTVIK